MVYHSLYRSFKESYQGISKDVFLLFVPVLGLFFIYNALRWGTILKVYYANGKRDMFPLSEISRQKCLKEFDVFLASKLDEKR